MGDYWHKKWVCPFFVQSGMQRVSCEGGCIQKFPDRETAIRFMDEYCASPCGGWKSCSVASTLLQYYERKEEDRNER